MSKGVVITGVGLISALGNRPIELHAALCGGRSAVTTTTLEEGDTQLTMEAARLADFDARDYIDGNLRPLDRSSMLAISAASSALTDAGLETEENSRDTTGLVLGTMFGSIHTISEFDRRGLTAGPKYTKPLVFANTVINAAAGQTAIRLGLRGVNSTISGGAASGLQALGYATDLVASGRNATAVAGGVEEFSFEAALGFARMGLLAGSADEPPRAIPFGGERNGCALGEGAAFLVLEDEGVARARGATIQGTILGHAQAFDPSRGREAESASSAMARAVELALADAAIDAAQIGCVFASANGSPRGDHAEGTALMRILGDRQPPVAAVKSALGETFGAAGALQAAAALQALHSGQVTGTPGLGTRGLGIRGLGIRGLAAPDPGLSALDLGALVRSPTGPVALITALGHDGHAAAVLLTAEER